jgi:hypothetical protein
MQCVSVFPLGFSAGKSLPQANSIHFCGAGGISLGPDLHLSRFERAGKRGIA